MAHSLAAATARGAALAAAPISSRVGLGFATRPRCPPTATVPTRSGVNLGRRHRTITTTTNSAGAAMAGAAAAAAAESSPGDDDALRLGFIGAGAMAEAMARGFVKGGVISFDRISASNSGNRERAAIWRDLGVDVCASNAEVLRKSDVVFLAVKPHILPGVLAEIAADAEDRHLFVSVAAGVSTTFIEQAIKEVRRKRKNPPPFPLPSPPPRKKKKKKYGDWLTTLHTTLHISSPGLLSTPL